jgi:hypothetical protein
VIDTGEDAGWLVMRLTDRVKSSILEDEARALASDIERAIKTSERVAGGKIAALGNWPRTHSTASRRGKS